MHAPRAAALDAIRTHPRRVRRLHSLRGPDQHGWVRSLRADLICMTTGRGCAPESARPIVASACDLPATQRRRNAETQRRRDEMRARRRRAAVADAMIQRDPVPSSGARRPFVSWVSGSAWCAPCGSHRPTCVAASAAVLTAQGLCLSAAWPRSIHSSVSDRCQTIIHPWYGRGVTPDARRQTSVWHDRHLLLMSSSSCSYSCSPCSARL